MALKMLNRASAKSLVVDLAARGLTKRAIEKTLERRGAGELLLPHEVEECIVEGRAARERIPHRPARTWLRVLGVLAILMGIGGILLNGDRGFGRLSPAGVGALSILVGIVLVIKPTWAWEDLR